MTNGTNVYIRTGNGKTARVYGSNSTTLERVYDVGSSNSASKLYVTIPANQNGHFVYYGNHWYLLD